MDLQFIILLIAKVLLVFYFFKAGINNAKNYSKLVNVLRAKGVPLPHIAMGLVIAVQILGSLAIVFDYGALLAAIALILFTIAANAYFCSYWTLQGMDRRNISFLFYANIAVMGGLLLLISQHF